MEVICSYTEQQSITTEDVVLFTEPQLRHEIPHAVPHDLLTYLWSSGNLCLLNDRCQALSHQTYAARFVILRAKVICLKPHCQPQEPGATLDLAPTF